MVTRCAGILEVSGGGQIVAYTRTPAAAAVWTRGQGSCGRRACHSVATAYGPGGGAPAQPWGQVTVVPAVTIPADSASCAIKVRCRRAAASNIHRPPPRAPSLPATPGQRRARRRRRLTSHIHTTHTGSKRALPSQVSIGSAQNHPVPCCIPRHTLTPTAPAVAAHPP